VAAGRQQQALGAGQQQAEAQPQAQPQAEEQS
jgi:hypothetical protein